MEPIEWAWYMPMSGDGISIGTPYPEREPTLEYLVRVIKTAETNGFQTILLPTQLVNNTYSEDAPYMDTWTIASAVGILTEKIRLLIAVKTGEVDPVRLAKMGATLDQITNGRMVFNITTGGTTLRRFGVTLSHDERYERTEEVMEIVKGIWTQNRFAYHGRYYFVENAVSVPKPVQKPYPEFYFAGLSEPAQKIAARLADVQLMRADLPEKIKEQVDELQQRASQYQRKLRFGLRVNVIVRETEAEAWDATKILLQKVDPRVLQDREKLRRISDSVQQSRIWSYMAQDDVIAPNLWVGLSRVRGGTGIAVVGSAEQVAARLLEYYQSGIRLFILAGYPQVEECERVGKQLLPLVNQMIQGAA